MDLHTESERRSALRAKAHGLEQEARAISADEVDGYRRHAAFIGAEFYGSMLAEPTEIGSLVEDKIIRLAVRP